MTLAACRTLIQCKNDVRLAALAIVKSSYLNHPLIASQRRRGIDIGCEPVHQSGPRPIGRRAVADLAAEVVTPASDCATREQSTRVFEVGDPQPSKSRSGNYFRS